MAAKFPYPSNSHTCSSSTWLGLASIGISRYCFILGSRTDDSRDIIFGLGSRSILFLLIRLGSICMILNEVGVEFGNWNAASRWGSRRRLWENSKACYLISWSWRWQSHGGVYLIWWYWINNQQERRRGEGLASNKYVWVGFFRFVYPNLVVYIIRP